MGLQGKQKHNTELESSLAEKDLQVLAATWLNISQQCALAAEKVNRLYLVKYCCLGEGCDPSLHLSIGEATPGVVCPVLDMDVLESVR